MRLVEKSPSSFFKNRDKCSTNSLAENQSRFSKHQSTHLWWLYASSFFLSFPLLFFFSSLHPRVSSVRATNQGDEHTCVNVTRTVAWMTRGEERETGERSECPFAEGEGQGKVDFWWLVKAGRIVSRCGGFTSGLAFSPFVFVRNTAVKRSSAASRNKWHGAPKTGPSPRRGPYLYEISS